MSKLPQQSSFDSARSVLERLFGDIEPTADALSSDVGREPANNTAIIFAAITQARAIDRLTKAVETNTRAVMLAADDTLSPRKRQELLEGR